MKIASLDPQVNDLFSQQSQMVKMLRQPFCITMIFILLWSSFGDWRLETGDWRLETGDWRAALASGRSREAMPRPQTDDLHPVLVRSPAADSPP